MKAYIVALVLCLGINASAASAQGGNYTIEGTMRHTTLEGGCWYLEGTDGHNYELVGDQSVIQPMHEEGLNLNLLVRNATGRASICMMGTIVEVIDRIQPSRHPIDLVIAPMLVDGRVHRSKGVWYAETKEKARYEWKGLPPKKYRKENARINTTLRVLLDEHSTKLKSAGLILGPPKKQPIEK